MRFTPADLMHWEPHAFVGDTRYNLTQDNNTEALRATCDSETASGLFYREPIDLTQTPIIEWRWRIIDPIQVGDPTEKSGDDYAARLYAVVDHRILRWRSRALNYVSTTRMPVLKDWPNAYASQAHMLAVDNAGAKGNDEAEWQIHRRNLREDFARFHGQDVLSIDAIALMTDCDDTGDRAEVLYGEIRLLTE